MAGPLWTPSPDRIARANLTRFGQGKPYAELYDWLAPGQLLSEPPEGWARDWAEADPDRFSV